MGRVLGLTGGIASGKSSVADLLRQLGAFVIDADRVARAVVAPGQPALVEIAAAFGQDVIDARGSLDRGKLAAKVFADPEARRRLEAITHPRIRDHSLRLAREALDGGSPIVIYEAALLVETGFHRQLDGLIVVTAPEPVRIERLMARDGIDREAALRRLSAQTSDEARLAVADHVVENDGDPEALRRGVLDLWRRLVAGT